MKAAYLSDEGAFLRYIEIPGADPPLLWLHGWQCSSTGELMAAAVQPHLRGRRSLLIDFLGHGYSDRPLAFPYTREAHARTIAALIDALGLSECGLVGHSMGGAVAVHVASARPAIVSLLILAEGALDAGGDEPFGGATEDQFIMYGFNELLDAQSNEAQEHPGGLVAAHLGITRVADPVALHREGVSLQRGTDPSVRSVLGKLQIRRWYLQGELSETDPELQTELAAMSVDWKIVSRTGHAMGIQNPEGLAKAVSEAVAASWPA